MAKENLAKVETKIDALASPENAVENAFAASAYGPLAHRQESIAQIFVEDANLEKLTNLFTREEPRLYAKIEYLLELCKAVGESEEVGFQFPDFKVGLIRRDYQLRDSYKEQTRKRLESITKIFERGAGEGARRGWLGRK